MTDIAGNPLNATNVFDYFVFAGDANRDRSVNSSDFAILAGRSNQPGSFSRGDFNYNGQVDIGDFSRLASKFNTTLAPAADAPTPMPAVGILSANARSSNPFATERVLDQLDV